MPDALTCCRYGFRAPEEMIVMDAPAGNGSGDRRCWPTVLIINYRSTNPVGELYQFVGLSGTVSTLDIFPHYRVRMRSPLPQDVTIQVTPSPTRFPGRADNATRGYFRGRGLRGRRNGFHFLIGHN